MINTPLVSVIMPAYNSAAFIRDAISSIQQQSYSHWELFVIDDASTDCTVGIVKDLMKNDSRINLIENKKNLGPGDARNKGIHAAKGNFIAFLDSDDLWLEEKLELQLRFMKRHEMAMCFSSYLLMEENGSYSGKMVEALEFLTYKKLLRSNYVGNLTGIYHVEKTGKIYHPSLRKRQDWALWLSILKNHGETRGIQQPLAVYRIRKKSLSNNKTALLSHNFKIYREFLDFGFLKSCRAMSLFLWEHFMVKKKQVKASNV